MEAVVLLDRRPRIRHLLPPDTTCGGSFGYLLLSCLPTISAQCESRRSPCSPLQRCRDRVAAELLRPNSRATQSSSEVHQPSLETVGCLGPPRPASYPVSHRELERRDAFGLVPHECSLLLQYQQLNAGSLQHLHPVGAR